MILISNRDREEVLRLLSLSSLYVEEARAIKRGKGSGKIRSSVRETELLRRIHNLEKRLKTRPTTDNRNNNKI